MISAHLVLRNGNCFCRDSFLRERSAEWWFLITKFYHILKQNENNFEEGSILIKTATILSKTNQIIGGKQPFSCSVISANVIMLCVRTA